MSNTLTLGNEQFRAASTAQIMQTLALHLEAIAHGQNPKWTVRSIEEFFLKELGLPPAPDGYEDVPRFLLPDSHQLQPHLDAPMLANTVASFMLPQPPKVCVVATNLRLLGQQLRARYFCGAGAMRVPSTHRWSPWGISSSRSGTNTRSCHGCSMNL
jgi:hypothetical protein